MANRLGILLGTVALNLILAALLLAARPAKLGVPESDRPLPRHPQPDRSPATAPAAEAGPQPGRPIDTKFHWSLLESEDYRQYLANLRKVECPEWLIQEILRAEIQHLYQHKVAEVFADEDIMQPWHGLDRRQSRQRERNQQRQTITSEEKRVLKELLGLELSNNIDWLNDYNAESIWFGFMDHAKATSLVAIFESTQEASSQIEQAAQGILIDEDHARLKQLQATMLTQMLALLSPTEFEELELRAQWAEKISDGEIHLDGVLLTGAELRAIARATKILGNTLEETFTRGRHSFSETEQEDRETRFAAEVKKILGTARVADYERAQDPQFREALEFTRQQQLPVSAAVRLSSAVRSATEQADQIKNDDTLTRDQQLEALAALKASTTQAFASVLGTKLEEFLASKNEMFDALLALPEPVVVPANGVPP